MSAGFFDALKTTTGTPSALHRCNTSAPDTFGRIMSVMIRSGVNSGSASRSKRSFPVLHNRDPDGYSTVRNDFFDDSHIGIIVFD
jgi:hypothetical protein